MYIAIVTSAYDGNASQSLNYQDFFSRLIFWKKIIEQLSEVLCLGFFFLLKILCLDGSNHKMCLDVCDQEYPTHVYEELKKPDKNFNPA